MRTKRVKLAMMRSRSLAEIMDAVMKLENGAPAIGGQGAELSSFSTSSGLSLGR